MARKKLILLCHLVYTRKKIEPCQSKAFISKVTYQTSRGELDYEISNILTSAIILSRLVLKADFLMVMLIEDKRSITL